MVELIARPGWQKVMNNFGFKRTHVVLEKQIKQASFYNIKKSQCEFIAENKYFLDGSPMNNTNKIINWPSDDSQYSVQDAHPSEEGDRKWADLVWKFCLHNNLF